MFERSCEILVEKSFGRFEKSGGLRVCRRGNWFKRGKSYKLDTRKWKYLNS